MRRKLHFQWMRIRKAAVYGCLDRFGVNGDKKENGRQAEQCRQSSEKKNISRQMGIQESRIHLSDSQTLLVRQ